MFATIPNKEYRARLLALNLCLGCISPLTNGKTLCDDCIAINKAIRKDRIAKCKAERKCSKCGHDLGGSKKSKCDDCLAEGRKRSQAHARQCLRDNVCSMCLKDLSEEDGNYAKCEACREKVRNSTSALRARRKANNRCPKCGVTLDDGWTKIYCATCHDHFNLTAIERRSRIKADLEAFTEIDPTDDSQFHGDSPERKASRKAAMKKLGML